MRKTHRRVSATAAVLATTVLLAGCQSAGTPETEGPESPQEEVTLTLSRWAGGQADAMAPLLEQYTAETGVKVRLDAIDYSQLKQKQTLNMSTATGEYDLIYVQEAWLNEYADADYLTPLDDWVKDPAMTGDDWDWADFTPSGVEVFTGSNGALYGIPYFVQTPLVVYNAEQLQADGLTAPKTWSEALEVAKFYKDKGTGMALPFRQGAAIVDVMTVLLAGNEADYFDANGALNLTDPAVIETVEFIKQLSAYGVEGSNGWHWDEAAKALQFGQAPIGITTSGLFTGLEDASQSNVAGKLGYAPIPYNKTASGLMSAWGWSIPKDSKHPEEAFKFLSWLTKKESLKALGTADPSFISFRNSLYTDADLAKISPWLPTVQEALANGVTVPLQPNAPALIDALGAALSGVVTGSDEPQSAMEGVQSALKDSFP